MRIRRLPLTVLLLAACGDKGDTSTSEATSGGGASSGEEAGSAPLTTAVTTGGEASGDTGVMSSASPTATGEPGKTGTPKTTAGRGETGDPSETGETGETGDDTGAVGCPADALPPGDHDVSIVHDGMMRTAIVHVPPGLAADAPAPLVFNFHGYTMTAAQQVAFTNMNPLADSEGFYVVYPDGFHTSWNAGACCGDAASQGVNDVGFVRALHAELAARLCLDAKRVYATGMSNGGFISNRLACEAADLFAAIGPVSAVNGMTECEPSRPIPVIAFNGTTDVLVPYDGAWYISVAESFAGWAERDGCGGAPTPGMTVGSASAEVYARCRGGVSVVQWTLEGMGHCWPGNPVCPYGAASVDIDANGVMWDFFGQYALP
jgi:polyhydroxybutyrate depolymerase